MTRIRCPKCPEVYFDQDPLAGWQTIPPTEKCPTGLRHLACGRKAVGGERPDPSHEMTAEHARGLLSVLRGREAPGGRVFVDRARVLGHVSVVGDSVHILPEGREALARHHVFVRHDF